MEVMYARKLSNNYFKNKNMIGFFGETRDLSVLIKNLETPEMKPNKKVKVVIGKNIDFIKSLGLDESLLSAKISELSESNHKLIKLVGIVLAKPEVIVLNNFEVGLNDKTITRLVRFLKTINATFNIKIIIISKNTVMLNKINNDIVIMKNKIIKYQGEIMPAILQGMIDKPEIIKFIDLAKKKDKSIEYTLDDKDLLKAVFRSVE